MITHAVETQGFVIIAACHKFLNGLDTISNDWELVTCEECLKKKSVIEEIRHAAVKSECGKFILLGKRHADCFEQGFYTGIKMSQRADDQGFVTSQGRYATRKQAAHLAKKAKQVKDTVVVLFSEDLWCEKDGGAYHYDNIKGYCK